MTDREALEMFLKCGLNSPDEVFAKFLALENAKSFSHDGEIDCVYVPGTREDRVLLAAHADTVFIFSREHEIIFDGGIYRSLSNESGIGADDRAGCAILWLLRNSGHSLLITNNEEIGSNGAHSIKEHHKNLFAEINSHQYIIEFDRRNAKDYKVYNIPVTEEFKRFIEKSTGYSEADKFSSSDINILCEKICGVNLSVGYYCEHTEDEYLNFHEWRHTLEIARKILGQEQKKYYLKK